MIDVFTKTLVCKCFSTKKQCNYHFPVNETKSASTVHNSLLNLTHISKVDKTFHISDAYTGVRICSRTS